MPSKAGRQNPAGGYTYGIPTIQLHAPHAENRTSQAAETFAAQLREQNICCTAVFGGFEGESDADIPTVVRMVGLVPEQTRAQRLAEMLECSGNDQYLHLETGQETADGLLTFINAVDRANLKINFDPANMVL